MVTAFAEVGDMMQVGRESIGTVVELCDVDALGEVGADGLALEEGPS
jgi:hypothetical protein